MPLTPMMQQYVDTKKEHSDCILFYRLGDFYEMFFEDAIIASKELDLVLTGKSCGLEEKAPMCGIPHHSSLNYINKLVQKGYKVAIGEQVEDPKTSKGLVKREVVRIVTPGTNQDLENDSFDRNNYLCSIAYSGGKYGISFVDITTGKFLVTAVDSTNDLLDEINRFMPVEIVYNSNLSISDVCIQEFCQREEISQTELKSIYFDIEESKNLLKSQFNVGFVEGLGLTDETMLISSGAVIRYLQETQRSSLKNILDIECYSVGKNMVLDIFTRRNLELVETIREAKKIGSLFWVLDKTKTAMGARFMRNSILSPLTDAIKLNMRFDTIEEFNLNLMARDEIREYLSRIYDLERLVSKVAYERVSPKDILALGNSLNYIQPLKSVLDELNSKLFYEINERMDNLEDVKELISTSISENAPLTIRDGNIIKDGYNNQIDEYRLASVKGKEWILELEQKERDRTGIKNLRIKFTKNFGYCVEISKNMSENVPNNYVRRQTLTTAERYTFEELKNIEDKILGANDKLYQLELELFDYIKKEISSNVSRILNTAEAIAELDFLQSLAYVAYNQNYTRPILQEGDKLIIEEGRHPVVEMMIEKDQFISNDVYLDTKKESLAIITGPNMAGKSTYMRQVALIALMSQIGSFVPAKLCKLGIIDRIFTRVGASDDLASGQSTFMVEMNEVANILRNATKRSLLILDEIGRGTSTYDGLSLAWSIVEYISNPQIIGAKTLFATHYHELTELEGKVANVINYYIDVYENNDNVVFLRKIKRGGADKSYGIQVAKLAGVPESVIERAKELALELDNVDLTRRISKAVNSGSKIVQSKQLTLFDYNINTEKPTKADKLLEELNKLEVDNITPREALQKIYELKERYIDE